MKYRYLIELVDDPTDPNELPYPREHFLTLREAEEAALFRSANHGLSFKVLKIGINGHLTEVNRFSPTATGS